MRARRARRRFRRRRSPPPGAPACSGSRTGRAPCRASRAAIPEKLFHAQSFQMDIACHSASTSRCSTFVGDEHEPGRRRAAARPQPVEHVAHALHRDRFAGFERRRCPSRAGGPRRADRPASRGTARAAPSPPAARSQHEAADRRGMRRGGGENVVCPWFRQDRRVDVAEARGDAADCGVERAYLGFDLGKVAGAVGLGKHHHVGGGDLGARDLAPSVAACRRRAASTTVTIGPSLKSRASAWSANSVCATGPGRPGRSSRRSRGRSRRSRRAVGASRRRSASPPGRRADGSTGSRWAAPRSAPRHFRAGDGRPGPRRTRSPRPASPDCFFSSWFTSVVLPLPRKPVTTTTGGVDRPGITRSFRARTGRRCAGRR